MRPLTAVALLFACAACSSSTTGTGTGDPAPSGTSASSSSTSSSGFPGTAGSSSSSSSSGGGTSSTSSGGDPSSTSSTSSASSTSSSGSSSGGTTHPECAAYASTYCGCLGSIAATDCVSTITSECDDGFDLCPSGYEKYTSCVVSEHCAQGWVDACQLDTSGC